MLKLTLILSSLFLLQPCFARDLATIKASGTIKVAVDGETPGFNFFKGKELVGFEIELINEMAKGMNLKVEYIVKPFNSLLVALNQDRFDMVGTSHTITPAREMVADFAKPYYCTGPVIVAKKGGPKTAVDLKGKTVAVAVGTVYFDFLNKLPGLKKIKSFPGENDGFRDMLAGQSDAWISEQFVAQEAMKAHPELEAGGHLFAQKNAMVVAKGNKELVKAIDDQLVRVLQNGFYAKLSQIYFKKDIRCM